MDKRVLNVLEFNKVVALISNHAFSDKAKEEILNLEPSDNIYLIEDKLKELDEAYRFCSSFSDIPVYGYKINKDIISRANKDGILFNEDFLKISSSIKTAHQVKKQILEFINNEEGFETLKDYANDIEDLSFLQKEIDKVIIDSETISDKATSTLYDIRRNIKNTNYKIKEKLNSIITSSEYRKYLSENIVTVRYSRYVVPVKSEYKGKVKGIVHDTSQTGATLFIEPEGVVTLNNKLKELEVLENREIEHILRTLSLKIKENSTSLNINENILLYLDVLNAKAVFSLKEGYTKPSINYHNKIILKKARHPLINVHNAVKSDIILNEKDNALIITGPNTGGKTVTLKTVGLCSLLFQCGIFIPASEGSSMIVFEKIYADIGDEQSIEGNLSTFSSHMTHIVDIVNNANSSTLVLLDELGVGTDPTEGAAIAIAIIDELKNRGCKIFATTHYSELKEYALIKNDVVNASVEFNVDTLSPTYKLILGIPGKSNAFEISKKLGLNKNIINKANKYLSDDNREIEDLINELHQKASKLDEDIFKNEKLLKENEILRKDVEEKERSLEENKSKIMLEASLKAKDIIADAKREYKEITSQLNKLKDNGINKSNKKNSKAENIAYANRIKEKIKEEEALLNSYIPSHELKKQSEDNNNDKKDFNIGDEVYIKSLDQYANILGFDGKDNVFIQAGIIKTKIPLSKIAKSTREKENVKKTAVKFSNQKAKDINPTLDIRGKYSDDAILEVEKYLDDAYLANLNIVTIIHGKGTGVLKETVANLLKRHSYVKSYRLGGINEGGAGATVVTLK